MGWEYLSTRSWWGMYDQTEMPDVCHSSWRIYIRTRQWWIEALGRDDLYAGAPSCSWCLQSETFWSWWRIDNRHSTRGVVGSRVPLWLLQWLVSQWAPQDYLILAVSLIRCWTKIQWYSGKWLNKQPPIQYSLVIFSRPRPVLAALLLYGCLRLQFQIMRAFILASLSSILALNAQSVQACSAFYLILVMG